MTGNLMQSQNRLSLPRLSVQTNLVLIVFHFVRCCSKNLNQLSKRNGPWWWSCGQCARLLDDLTSNAADAIGVVFCQICVGNAKVRD